MYKLTVVGGPTRGSTYSVTDGNVSIGRVTGNDIVLDSNKVSKRHCVLVVDNTGVTVKDAGSSNGTFVNGVLAKAKRLAPGDRISVGEYVLELTRLEVASSVPTSYSQPPSYGNVLPFPVSQVPQVEMPVGATTANASPGVPPKNKSLVEKIKFNFDKYVINFLYNLNEKHEWRSLITSIFAAAILFSISVSVYLVTQRTDQKLQFEARNRASLLARQIVDRNTVFVLERMETKTDVGFAEKERGVHAAYLIDMEGRILAPGRKLNQYIAENKFQASFAAAARKAFQEPERSRAYFEMDTNTIAVAEPLRVMSPTQGKNVTVAMGLVFFDQRIVTFDSGTEWMMFFNAAVLASIFALAAFVSIYRLTLRPIQHLNQEVDLVLKGSTSVVTRKFRMSEMDSLVDIINAGLQRIGGGSPQSSAASDGVSSEAALAIAKLLGEKINDTGVMVFSKDARILSINAFMEDTTGIRSDAALGNEIEAVAREAAFASFVQDLLGRTQPGNMGMIQETFEISGVNYRFECHGLGFEGSPSAGFVLIAERES